MGFVKTADEVAAIRRTLTGVEFVGGEMLSVDLQLDHTQVAALLPPGFEAAPDGRATVTVGRWRSNCCGDFAGGAVYLAATYEGIAADYVLTMFMDQDSPLLFGRDLYGEPKKIAQASLYRQGGEFTGTLERKGVELVRIEASLGADEGASQGTGRNFNVKGLLSADGTGLQADPEVTLAEFDTRVRSQRRGSATLTLQGSRHDPLDELAVVSVLGARFVEADMKASCRSLGTLDASAFLPYAYGRMDDWSAMVTGRADW
jgi:acetoacetate decarboxylase